MIRKNPNWQFVKIYSDVGSVLRTKNRQGYRQMILDGKKGLFDFVLIKSLSRFGRDTVETLAQIRNWKQMNIGLYAEMEDIDTMKVNDSALSIFLAMDQEESCNKSVNIKFGIRARMLSNEKYIGQVLMKKTYTPDFLSGKQAKNYGALSMFLVENAHEAIIDKETFEKVHERKKVHQSNRINHPKIL